MPLTGNDMRTSIGIRAAIASRLLQMPARLYNPRLRHLASILVENLILRLIRPAVILFHDRNELRYFLYPGDDWLYEYGYCHGYHEVAEQEFCKRYVGERMTVVDVGAQYGQYTLLFSKLASSGSVHAFEPTPYAFGRLTENLALNDASNVVANRAAVFSQRCTATLHVYEPGWSGCNSLARRGININGMEIKPIGEELVEAVTLDEYCRGHGLAHIDLMKIDVEGLELEVLQGATGLLESGKIDCIVLEVGITMEDYGDRQRDVLNQLARYSYKVYRFQGPSLAPYEHTEPLERTNLIAIRDGKELRSEIFGPYESRIPEPPIRI